MPSYYRGESPNNQTSTPSQRLIDPNESLPRRGRASAHADGGAAMAARVACVLVATACLALAAAASATASARTVLRTRCSVGSCGSRRAPGSWSGFVRRRPRRRRRAWLGSQLRGRESSFQSGALRGTTGLRRAARACSLSQACRGTPTQSGALPVALYRIKLA